jgi:hypothetical protein
MIKQAEAFWALLKSFPKQVEMPLQARPDRCAIKTTNRAELLTRRRRS